MDYTNEDRRKHLEFVQQNIARMAENSFRYKAWLVVIVTALFAAAASSKTPKLILLSALPVVIFWLLDSFHLAAEKKFRKLYNEVRLGSKIEFEMTPDPITYLDWIKAAMSKTLLPLYSVFVLTICLSYAFLRG